MTAHPAGRCTWDLVSVTGKHRDRTLCFAVVSSSVRTQDNPDIVMVCG